MKNIGVAVAGAGFIGPVHVEALRRIGVRVTGILGVDAKESEKAAQSLGLPRAYTNFEEILNDDTVSAVHVATPNKLHFDMASRALRAGKHVMCEKPLAMDARESRELVSIAQKAGCAAGVNYNNRSYPLSREAAVMVQRGDIGKVFSVCGSYAQDWMLYDTDYNWRVLANEGGQLRAVADIGTHWLDLVQFITGLEIESVCADVVTFHETRKRPLGEVETFSGGGEKEGATEDVAITTDDHACMMFRFSNGARGSLWVSQVTAGRKNCLRYEIAGSKAALSFNSEEPNVLWVGHREKPNELLLRDPSLLSAQAQAFANFPGGHNEGFPDAFKHCFREFYEYISRGDMSAPQPFPTFAEGYREVVLCEAILESHRCGGWVKLSG